MIDHRDLTLFRIDTRTNAPTKVTTLAADAAPERMVFLAGKLWITGRGADLMRVDPPTGAVEATYEIGAERDRRRRGGRRALGAGPERGRRPQRLSDDGGAPPRLDHGRGDDRRRARGRLDVHGLVAGGGAVWLADNTNGVLYRLAY